MRCQPQPATRAAQKPALPKHSARRPTPQYCYTLALRLPLQELSRLLPHAVRRFFPPMKPRANRALFTVVLFFAVCALVGSVLQSRVGAQSAADQSQLRDSLKAFTSVYALVEQNYADPINGDK